METILAKIGAWFGAIFPAALGSALALFINKAQKLSKLDLILTFIFGINMAHILGGAAIEHWHIDPRSFIASAIQFTIGLMGMATLAQVMLQLPLVISGLRKKYIGGE